MFGKEDTESDTQRKVGGGAVKIKSEQRQCLIEEEETADEQRR